MKLKFLSAEFTLEELAEGAPFLKKLFVDVLHYHETPKEAAVKVLEKFIFVTFDEKHTWVFYMDEAKDEAELTCICEAYKQPQRSTIIYQQDKWFCWTPKSGHQVLGVCCYVEENVYINHWPQGKTGVVTLSWFKNGDLRQADYRNVSQGNLVGYYGFVLHRKDEELDSPIVDFLYFDDKGPHMLQKKDLSELRERFNY